MPESLPLSYDRTLGLLREVIEEFGADHVAPRIPDGVVGGSGCQYVYEGKPSCLVGQVLYRAGVSLAELTAVEGSAPQLEEFTRWAGPAARRLLAYAQEEQDAGRAWGVALAHAIELAGDSDG